ncbi:thiol peroxidase [bacterium]|nr:MAG: thiol peroxidase [bacterium]
MTERIGEAFEFGEQLTVVGDKLQVGDKAPDFALDYFDAAKSAMESVQLADTAGQIRLLHVVNSLDTPVCHIGTHRWHHLSATLPAGVTIYTISMDLPFAQARWQAAEGVTHHSLSSHRSDQFGKDYGVLLKEWRLLQRSVFVIDANDQIIYAEYVNDQMQEPNYQAAFDIIRQTAA